MMGWVLRLASGLIAATSFIVIWYSAWWPTPGHALVAFAAMTILGAAWLVFVDLTANQRGLSLLSVVMWGALLGGTGFIGWGLRIIFACDARGFLMTVVGAIALIGFGHAWGDGRLARRTSATATQRVTPVVVISLMFSIVGLFVHRRPEPVAVVDARAPLDDTGGRFLDERDHHRDAAESVGRTCIGYRCVAHLRTPSGATRTLGPAFPQDADVRVVRNPRRDTLMLEANGRVLAVLDDDPNAWEWRDPTVVDSGVWTRAFPSFVAVSLAGAWVALMLLLLGRTHRQKLAVARRSIAGFVEHGWLRIPGAIPRRIPETDLEGPVLVRPARVHIQGEPYRGGKDDREPLLDAGDRDTVIETLCGRVSALDRAAAIIAVFGALPLAAAFVAELFLL